jgi:N-6 DNA Methylase
VTLNELPGTVTAEFNRDGIHDFTLKARHLLTEEIWTILEGVYGLRRSGGFEPGDRLRAYPGLPEVQETRDRLQRYLEDEVQAGLRIQEAVEKLVKEVAFTHLNRLVAFKMLEARKLIRGTVDKYQDSNAFKFYLVDHQDDMALYEAGSMPQNAVGEGPRDIAYRHFLLWQCGQLAREINVLFDPANLPSRLFPRPTVLRQLIDIVNAPELADAWAVGNEETIGWVYQDFSSEELEHAFAASRLQGKKFEASDIPDVTQLFTPRWIVRYLVHNTLGRTWIRMHPDSKLQYSLDYLVPLEGDVSNEPVRPVRQITLLDPACGTMHFGLVAFDLFAEMYREEIERAGESGWPNVASVEREEEIPAAIVANNLFGIDIDLRAVQLSALTLYLKAKTLNKDAVLRESNLVVASVHPLDGERLDAFLAAARLTRPVFERVLRVLWDRLRDTEQLGSLIRPEVEIRELIHMERERYQREAAGRLPFAETVEPFGLEAQTDDFWEFLDLQVSQALDEFVRTETGGGRDMTFFAGEAVRGFRLLEVLMRHYDVVVTNPPYMSHRKMNDRLKSLVARGYPSAKQDLYAAFIQRCLELTSASGRVGMLTMHSFMFIGSYENLRKTLLDDASVETVAHCGPGLFDVGNPGTLQTAAHVLRKHRSEERHRDDTGIYFRLVKEPNADAKRRGFEGALGRLREPQPKRGIMYHYRQADFAAIEGSPWVYWIPQGIRRIFETFPNLGQSSPARQGLATTKNFRFLRQWWEPGINRIGFSYTNTHDAGDSGFGWFPYMKGGSFRRWWGNQTHVVNWASDGAEIKTQICVSYPYLNGKWEWVAKNTEYYFRRGITYSYLTSATFSARLSPGGFIFDVAGSSLFPRDVPLVLGVLNSSFAAYALHLINPTVNFQVGDLARLPIPNTSSERLRVFVDEAVNLARADGHELEVTYDFVIPPAVSGGLETVAARNVQLTDLERQIDGEVYRLYGIDEQDRTAIARELSEYHDDYTVEDGVEVPDSAVDVDATTSLDRQKLAQWWISYAVGIGLGRFQIGVENGLGRGKFSHEVNEALGKLASTEGILSLDLAIPRNVAHRVEQALDLMLDEVEARGVIEQATGGKSLASYLERDFFKDHVQRYGKRPVYWLLQSPKRGFGVYVFHERITKDTLYVIQGNQYLGGKINQVQGQVDELHSAAQGLPQGRERKQVERELDDAQNLLTELESFAQALKAVTSATNERGEEVGWNLEIDDGVLINLAPLHTLMPAWSTEPKKAWESLRKGEWDWSHTAMRYWPDRVLEKCRTNKSFAIAHGRMDVYEGNE